MNSSTWNYHIGYNWDKKDRPSRLSVRIGKNLWNKNSKGKRNQLVKELLSFVDDLKGVSYDS